MGDALKDPRVVAILRVGSVKSMLTSMLERLERCQKSLNDFLEEKRNSFPRFYFVGDEDLLAILGQASKPAVVQTHLKKLFAGIHSVNFDPEGRNILTMNSIQGEVVPLRNSIRISSEVEGWLNQLSKEMKNTLKQQLEECVAEGRKANGSLDPLKYPSQVEWTRTKTMRQREAFNGKNLLKCHFDKWGQFLNSLTPPSLSTFGHLEVFFYHQNFLILS